MLVVETIAKIRRAFFVQGKAIKAICRDLGVSRKVVRKVIRSGSTEFRYHREDQPLPKIGRWRDTLDQLLEGAGRRQASQAHYLRSTSTMGELQVGDLVFDDTSACYSCVGHFYNHLRELLRSCHHQSALTYPALEQGSEPRWRSAQPGPHNQIDLMGPLSFTGFQAVVRLLGHLASTTRKHYWRGAVGTLQRRYPHA